MTYNVKLDGYQNGLIFWYNDELVSTVGYSPLKDVVYVNSATVHSRDVHETELSFVKLDTNIIDALEDISKHEGKHGTYWRVYKKLRSTHDASITQEFRFWYDEKADGYYISKYEKGRGVVCPLFVGYYLHELCIFFKTLLNKQITLY